MNPGSELEIEWVRSMNVNEAAVNRTVEAFKKYVKYHSFTVDEEVAWLLRAVSVIDLTTLAGDDTDSNVHRLCRKALKALSPCVLECPELEDFMCLRTAAVCVYPRRVAAAVAAVSINQSKPAIPVASVASGFPSGQYPLDSRLKEIEYCVANGATEIDIVVSRDLVITEQWEELYREIKAMKEACGAAHLKTILAAGECATLANVYKASLVAMMAGSDFIKTSTGKEAVNATFPIGIVMCRAINSYHIRTGIKVGFKPAGGIRTYKDALAWLILIKQQLGHEWMSSELFRIGASGLLTDIEKRIYYLLKSEKDSSCSKPVFTT
ncbi:deoxyribose-phosphate aldolase [Nilaparvata lugens]|uniref:deoxyribose-phosphate aldolase n=1 Tax=Nilaparvata lugens TaxID=108931 RepID=UPI00193E1B22|nr:deoxyribose-phosphate aldolase [Nilaparvata lugens]